MLAVRTSSQYCSRMPKTRFGTWHALRVTRERTGISSAELAKSAVDPDTGKPMSPGYLSDLESGKRWPNAKVTKRLAVALQVPYIVIERRDRPDDEDAA